MHAYELFCKNVKRTNHEMSDDVDEHLMWELLQEDEDNVTKTGYAIETQPNLVSNVEGTLKRRGRSGQYFCKHN